MYRAIGKWHIEHIELTQFLKVLECKYYFVLVKRGCSNIKHNCPSFVKGGGHARRTRSEFENQFDKNKVQFPWN